jgi:hypothetical protein
MNAVTREFDSTSSECSTRDQSSSSALVALAVCRVFLALTLAASSPFVELANSDLNWASYEPCFVE